MHRAGRGNVGPPGHDRRGPGHVRQVRAAGQLDVAGGQRGREGGQLGHCRVGDVSGRVDGLDDVAVLRVGGQAIVGVAQATRQVQPRDRRRGIGVVEDQVAGHVSARRACPHHVDPGVGEGVRCHARVGRWRRRGGVRIGQRAERGGRGRRRDLAGGIYRLNRKGVTHSRIQGLSQVVGDPAVGRGNHGRWLTGRLAEDLIALDPQRVRRWGPGKVGRVDRDRRHRDRAGGRRRSGAQRGGGVRNKQGQPQSGDGQTRDATQACGSMSSCHGNSFRTKDGPYRR